MHLSDAEDLRATIAGLPGLESDAPINVHFGDSDFVNKYRLLVENIGPWRASAGHVESVDLRFPRQVVVNPERVAASRPVSKPVARPVRTPVSRPVSRPVRCAHPFHRPAAHPAPHPVLKTVARKAPVAAHAAKIKPAKIKPVHLKKANR